MASLYDIYTIAKRKSYPHGLSFVMGREFDYICIEVRDAFDEDMVQRVEALGYKIIFCFIDGCKASFAKSVP